jgi:endonuclease/exonuclease/phosphatase family metal-dependent hydrolase
MEADVVFLQESGPRIALLRMAAALGMQVANDPFSFPRRRVKNAVLVRFPWRLAASRLHRFPRSARFYPRGVLVAELAESSAAPALIAASVHLGLRPGERLRHGAELQRVVSEAAAGRPAVIGGDFNEFPEGRAIRALSRRFTDAAAASAEPTFPARQPTARIDYVFLTRDLELLAARVPLDDEVVRGSDHLPVIVETSLPR